MSPHTQLTKAEKKFGLYLIRNSRDHFIKCEYVKEQNYYFVTEHKTVKDAAASVACQGEVLGLSDNHNECALSFGIEPIQLQGLLSDARGSL